MKKLLIALAMCGLSMGAMAQETTADPTLKHSVATNSFWSNWFIQAGADWNAFYSNQEHGQGLDRSPFKKFRATPGFSVAVGKWFTPGLGLRTKFSGVWGRTVIDEHKHSNDHWTLNENILFNLSNMIYGYNETRVWNFVPFVGAGINRTCDYNRYAMNLSAGILNTFRLSKHVGLYFELGWNYAEEDFDGISAGKGSRVWEGKDNRLYAEVGLTGSGRTHSKYHIVLFVSLDELLLVLAAALDRSAADAIYQHAFHGVCFGLFAFHNIKDILFIEHVVFS